MLFVSVSEKLKNLVSIPCNSSDILRYSQRIKFTF